MKTTFTILTIIELLTFCLAGSLSADRLLYEHSVHKENENVDVTKGHPWWQGDGDATTRDGDITASAEKRIFDVSESQAKATVSSSVEISCNVDDGSFVGVAQIKGTADMGASAFLANSYQGIASNGIPDTLSTSDLDTYQGKSGNASKTAYVLRLPGTNSSLLYSGIERHGVLLKKGTSLGPITIVPTKNRDLDFEDSASTVKQKAVGATDSDIIAMFSPYASANGSAQNNAGQGISNQVPSASADTNMDSDDDDGNSDTQTNNYVAPPSTSTGNTQITGDCGIHTIASSESSNHKETTGACGHTYYACSQGDHDKLQASCSTDSNCISTNFYLCKHTSHTYGRQACGHTYNPGSSSANSHRSVTHPCGRHSYYACQTPSSSEKNRHTYQTLPCGDHRYYPCRVLPKHKRAITCPRDSNGQSCSHGTYYACSPHTHLYPSANNNNNNGNSGNGNSDNSGDSGSSGLVTCGGARWTGCSGASSRTQHHVPSCSNCGNAYWTCSEYASRHTTTYTCQRTGCGASLTRCQNGPGKCVNGGYHWLNY